MPSFLADALPGIYRPLVGLFPPAWQVGVPGSPGDRAVIMALYMGLAGGLWAAYLAALRVARGIPAGSRPSLRAVIVGGAVLFGVCTLAWPGLFSTDVYAYAVYGKMQVVYSLNPLVHPPRDMGSDPWLAFIYWRDIPAPYGPLWLGLTRLIATGAHLLGGHRLLYLLGFKLFNLGLLAAGTGLVWAIGARRGWPAARCAESAVLFGWCPLLLLEGVGNAHNDLLLIVAVLVAVWLHLRGAWPLAVMALVAAGLVKLPGFLFLPAYLVLLARTAGSGAGAARRLAVSMGLVVGLTLAAYAFYTEAGASGAPAAAELGWFGSSPAAALRQVITDTALLLRGTLTPATLSARDMYGLLRWPLWGGLVALWGGLAAVCCLRVRDFPGLLRAWGLIVLSYLGIAATAFFPWYITWLIPVLALLPPGRLRRAGLLLALGGTLVYGVSARLLGDATPSLGHYYIPLVIFLPAALYLLGTINARGWRAPASIAP